MARQFARPVDINDGGRAGSLEGEVANSHRCLFLCPDRERKARPAVEGDGCSELSYDGAGALISAPSQCDASPGRLGSCSAPDLS